jgi:hypothetical protein
MDLPPGWHYTPMVPASRCEHCGHEERGTPGSLRAPSGRWWPLVGNSSAAQERKMVAAIIEAHPDDAARAG